MYDINIKNVKKGRRFYYIFFVVGLLFFTVIVGVFVAGIIKLNSLDASIMSTNVKVKSYVDDEGTTMYSPVYYYKVNGQEYICSSNSSSSKRPSNINKLVYYDSKNPSNCMSEYSKSSNKILLFVLIIPIIFIIFSVINIMKVNKRIKLIKELNQKGKLVKNLPYHLEDTGMSVNGVQIQRPVVEYTLPSGSKVVLQGDPRHDGKVSDSDGLVDLVIDENDPNNYFIDFEINRLTGNLESDFYNNGNSIQQVPNNQTMDQSLSSNNDLNRENINDIYN